MQKNRVHSIVYWIYLCVSSLESLVSIFGSSCSFTRGPRAYPLRHRISPFALSPLEVLRAADVCTHYLSVYTTVIMVM